MPDPFVGLPVAVITDRCAYAGPDLDGAACTEPAVTHVIGECGGWGVVALSACSLHAATARLSVSVIAEHSYGEGCFNAGCVNA